jgi:hypothetical protein
MRHFCLCKEVSFLLADVHDDARLSGSVFVVPASLRERRADRDPAHTVLELFATANNQRREQCACNSQCSAIIHKAADNIQRGFLISTLKSVLIGWLRL